MARKRYSDEGALKILREIDVHLHDVLEVMHRLLMKHGKPNLSVLIIVGSSLLSTSQNGLERSV